MPAYSPRPSVGSPHPHRTQKLRETNFSVRKQNLRRGCRCTRKLTNRFTTLPDIRSPCMTRLILLCLLTAALQAVTLLAQNIPAFPGAEGAGAADRTREKDHFVSVQCRRNQTPSNFAESRASFSQSWACSGGGSHKGDQPSHCTAWCRRQYSRSVRKVCRSYFAILLAGSAS